MVSVDVREYGAVGDGTTDDTEAIQAAVDDCSNAGGGTVMLSAGEYLTTPVFLRDDVTVHVSNGATVLGSTDIAAYPAVNGRWEGIEREVYASLFTGHDLENVAITGQGTIDGQGEAWWAVYREDEKDYSLGRDRPYPGKLNYPRPRVVNLYDCENVLIRDVTITGSPSWTIHPVYCENVTVDRVTVVNDETSVNTDGINPDSCRDVHISNCHIDVGDDCLTIKSGYNEDGRRVGEPCENVVVTNCTMRAGHGGVVIGSEMSADVRNVAISNCVFDGTDRGIRIKTARGRGGVVENVRASTIVMRDIERSAFTLSMRYHTTQSEPKPITEETPQLRDIRYENVTVTSCRTAALVEGLPEMAVADFGLSNVRVESAEHGLDLSYAEGVFFDDVTVDTEETPLLEASAVTSLEVDRLRAIDPDGTGPMIRFEDVNEAFVRSCRARDWASNFLELVGDDNTGIELRGNHPVGAEREGVAVQK